MKQLVSRKQAIMVDAKRYYTGKPCGRGHLAERFTTNGVCVDCSEENNAKRAEEPRKGIMSGLEVQNLLMAGGPNSRAMAEAAGTQWFNPQPGDQACPQHGIMGVKDSCPLCGRETRVAVSKQVIDLLS